MLRQVVTYRTYLSILRQLNRGDQSNLYLKSISYFGARCEKDLNHIGRGRKPYAD